MRLSKPRNSWAMDSQSFRRFHSLSTSLTRESFDLVPTSCVESNKSKDLGRATDDAVRLGETAITLLKLMKAPPEELRGIGLVRPLIDSH